MQQLEGYPIVPPRSNRRDRHIDDGLARKVAHGPRLREMPKPADAARPTRQDLPESPALSIIRNAPKSLAGRKRGPGRR